MTKIKLTIIIVSLLLLLSPITLTTAEILTTAPEPVKNINKYLGPKLSITPTFHDFGEMIIGDSSYTTFEIWNSGCCLLQYTLTEHCSWITIQPTQGTSAGEHDIITVSVETNLLVPGEYHCDIYINSDGGEANFSVSINCSTASGPKITLSPRSYDFGNQIQGATPSTSFEVWNCGIGNLTYEFINLHESYLVNPRSGTSTGEHDIITLIINTSGLPTGVHTGYLQISTNNGIIFFIFTINIKNITPELSYSPHSYNFGYKQPGETDFTTFEIWNSGIDKLTYLFDEDCDWITITPTYGVSSGEHDTITVGVDTTGLEQRINTYDIIINTNAGDGYFTVTLLIGDGYTNITVNEAWDFLATTSNGVQIPIDVRYDNEWAVAHIDTPAPENPHHHCVCAWSDDAVLQAFMEEHQGQEIILYCKAGSRSTNAANILFAHNFTGTIYNMIGGIDAWIQAGYPTKPNLPPNTPTINGETNGKIGEEYQYAITATDPDADEIYYYINWSDNTTNQLIGPFHSAEEIILNHTWVEKGTYTIKVKARDFYGSESDYATLTLKMPKKSIKNLLLDFVLPQHVLQILRRIIYSFL